MNEREIAANTMKQAAVLVSTTRGQQHGELEPSFTMIAELWSVWVNHSIAKATGIAPMPAIHLTAFDALQMMSMVKKGRSIYGDRGQPDHYIDDIGYTGLAAGLALGANPPVEERKEMDKGYKALADNGAVHWVEFGPHDDPHEVLKRLSEQMGVGLKWDDPRVTEPIPTFLSNKVKKAAQ